MPELLLYLLKVNAALLLFYLAYHAVLRRLTFYTLNRLFLVFGIGFSALYPFVDLSGLFSQHQELAQVYTYTPTMPEWVLSHNAPEQTATFDYWQIAVFLFWLGAVVMALRLLQQFASLYKIHTSSTPAIHKSMVFRETPGITEAFSFWQSIYLNPRQHKPGELDAILRHELAHVQGWHTLDVLLAELSTVLFWFNPGVWLLKKALKENLEFIADRQVVTAGADRKTYQYLLLKITGPPEPRIANQFHFPSLKTRIVMMNKNKTSLRHIARYAVLIPLIAAPTLLATAYSKAPEAPTVKMNQQESGSTTTASDSVVYYIDGVKTADDAIKKLNPNDIHSVNVLKGESARNILGEADTKGVVVITTKKNQNAPKVLEFNKKISAESPGKPGTPVKVEQQQELPPPPAPVRYNGPAIPKAGGAHVVENKQYIVYTLWPEEITKRELEVAKQAFKESGFEFSFVEKYEGGKINTLKIDLTSSNNRSKASTVYSAESIRNLLDADNIVLVQANKKTGEVSISHTLAPR